MLAPVTRIDARPTPWDTVILLCGKCARKLDGGYGAKRKETLRKALRAGLKQAGHGRGVRIMETRCMGLCPKGAVAAVNASAPGQILTVPKGTGMDEALDALLVRDASPA